MSIGEVAAPRPEIGVPTLSVLVLNYNYGRYLERCLQSILGQTFEAFELIVIDDCSKDDSVAVLRRFAEADPRVRVVIHEKNAGFKKSLIEGTEELSRGEFLTVISADDFAAQNDAFATQIDLLRRYPSSAFCFSGVEIVGSVERIGQPRRIESAFAEETVLEPAAALSALLNQTAWPTHSGTIIRTAHYKACGGYRRDITMALDLAMWLSLAIEGGFSFTPLPLYAYRVHGSQMSVAIHGIRTNAREVRCIIEDTFREATRRGYALNGTNRTFFVRHFEGYALHDAFNSRRQQAFYRMLTTAIESPLGAIGSRRLWLAALRCAIGARGFAALRSVARRLPLRTTHATRTASEPH